MVKDVSARCRAGNSTAAGQTISAASNAETDALSKQLLALVSSGSTLIKFMHVCTRILLNCFNALYAGLRENVLGMPAQLMRVRTKMAKQYD